MNPLEENHAHFAQAAHVEGQVVVVGCLVVPAVPSIEISGNQENFVSNQQQNPVQPGTTERRSAASKRKKDGAIAVS